MTLTVSATPAYDAQPNVVLSVSSSPGATGELSIVRVHEDGAEYPVLTDRQPVLNGGWGGIDYHAPTNQLVTYRASAAGMSAETQTYLPSDQFWLAHPSDPEKSVPVLKVLAPQEPIVLQGRSEKTYVLGNPRPIIRPSSARGEAGKATVQVCRADVSAVKALMKDSGPILMNGPWGADDFGWAWIFPDDPNIINPAGFLSFPTRNIAFSYEVCEAPDVDVSPVWTYADARAEFAGTTYAALRASGMFDSYTHLRLNIRTS